MNRSVLALALVLASAVPALADRGGCTQDMVVGTYALAVQGSTFVALPGQSQPAKLPFASLAIVSIDADGVLAGTANAVFAGKAAESAVSGRVAVSRDCTAIVTTGVGTTSTDIILDGGDTLVGLMIEFPAGRPALTGTAKRISRMPLTANRQCRRPRVQGTYAVSYTGEYMVPVPGVPQRVPMPAFMLGRASIDHFGRVSGQGTASIAGQAMPYEIVDGQLSLGDGCTAAVQMTVNSGGVADTGTSWLVVLRGGEELWAIQIASQAAAPVVAGTWKRISWVVDDDDSDQD
jgi:hypothetical protein